MKSLLVTSRVTFVPENYARLVSRMAEHPQVSALLILENRSLGLAAKGLGLSLSRSAPGIGTRLIKNSLKSFFDPRVAAFRKAGKEVYSLPDINSSEALEIISKGKFDLVINARTRFIYAEAILKAPPLGCINIHHGLLPEQRGVFCDLWALSENRAAGFSIHQMSTRLDDGEILKCQTVPSETGLSYSDYLIRGSGLEAEVLSALLEEIATKKEVSGVPNVKNAQTKYFRNPKLSDLKNMRKKGFFV